MTLDGLPLENTLHTTLGMEILEARPDCVRIRMPVGPRVHQPYGILHGGASVALAESAASLAAALNVDRTKQWAVGLEINANHLRAVREGNVTAEALPIHRGRSTSVWEVKIRDDAGRLVCISRCTVAIVSKREGGPTEGG